MTLEEACAEILGPETTHAIIMDMGLRWALVAAVAAAKTTDNPEALAAISEDMNDPMPAEALGRFTQYVRERLASLEQSAAPPAEEAQQPPFPCNCNACPHPTYCRASFSKCPA